MKRSKSLLLETRESLLGLLAGTVEGYQRVRSKLPDTDRAAPGGDADQGDFLYDFARLNLSYLNRLARLGSNYSVVAARVLERLYDHYVPTDEPSEPGTLFVQGEKDELATVRVHVENALDVKASFEVACTTEFEADGDHEQTLKVQFQHPKRRPGARVNFELDGDESMDVRLGIKLTSALVRGVDYSGRVVVTRRRVLDTTRRAGQKVRELHPKVTWVHPLVVRRVGA